MGRNSTGYIRLALLFAGLLLVLVTYRCVVYDASAYTEYIYNAEVEQEARRGRISQVCSTGMVGNHSYHQFWVNAEHQFAYCVVPKVACTNWKRALLLATAKIPSEKLNKILQKGNSDMSRNPSEVIHARNFTEFNLYKKNLLTAQEKSYFKFFFVRCPYHRLLSAYRDKLQVQDELTQHFRKKYGIPILKKYRPHASQHLLETGTGVTFVEFLRFIIDNDKENVKLDIHWRPMYKLCNPCDYKFDFIGKLETLEEDSTYVLQHIGAVSGYQEFPSENNGPTSSRSSVSNSAAFKDYYSKIPADIIKDIVKVYYNDFILFGYETDINVYF